MKVATLGPAGTFSQQAAEKLVQSGVLSVLETPQPASSQPTEPRIHLYSHLQRCLQALPEDADRVVVPIENVSEGFVPVVLDHLVGADLHITHELHLPIAFHACACVEQKSDITRLYVQFVARGQCREFVDSLGDIEIVPTQSNSESLQLAEAFGAGAAAIIPAHFIEQISDAMTWQQHQVHDYEHNQTRFVVLASGPVPDAAHGAKTSLMVINDDDRPGLLEKVLHCFSTRKLNLTSIVSRPTGQGFGRYHFFMDVQADVHDIAMQGALRAVAQLAQVKVLGCY